MAARRITLGLRPHTGWAAMVAVEARNGGVALIVRRRVTLVEEDLPRQVYHTAQDLTLAETNDLVRRVRANAFAAAASLFREFLEDGLAGMGMVAWQPDVPDQVERILASHQLMHAAEGDLYRSALLGAADAAGVPTFSFLPTDLNHVVAAAVGLSQGALAERLAVLGRAAGPPWQKDQKEATLAAWAVMHLTAPG